MGYMKKNIKKLCNFYVSDWHLVTMLIPYINNQLNQGVKITTILENDIQENVVTLVKKLNLKNEHEILKIDWQTKSIGKFEELQEKLKIRTEEEIIIVLNGSMNYINRVNEMLEKNAKQHPNKKFKIINCFEVSDFNGNINEILETHDKILNTSGEKEIEEVFDGYQSPIIEKAN